MSTEFVMPKLGLTMEEGKIIEWLVDDGAHVEAGTPVLRIETDKVESDVESPASGRLKRTALAGDTFKCGEVIGRLLGDGETDAVVPATLSTTSRVAVSPNAYRVAAALGVDPTRIAGSGPAGRVVSEDVEEYARRQPTAGTAAPVGGSTAQPAPSPSPMAPSPMAPSPIASAQRSPGRMPVLLDGAIATMAARQLADLLGIDLAAVPASSDDGRISREDVAAHVRSRLAAGSTTPPARQFSSRPAPDSATVRPMTGMRSTIARRMHEALIEMAQLTLTMEAECDNLLAHRAQCSGRVVPGITDYVLAATARALRTHPVVNSQMTQDGIAVLPDIHIGLAVAVEGGLLVPVIRNTDRRGLLEIAEESQKLARSAREGKLTMNELDGGTMSVTALGMFGVDAFTPVINPPNSAILGVGRIRPILSPQVLSAKDALRKSNSKKSAKKSTRAQDAGSVSLVQAMTLSLTWDHRVFDGVPAAEFCRSIVENLQDPESLERPLP
ncbi:MAG: 2-oxo acid dehydrogenase subunit E2 [Actinomycetota bacterium]